jgi:hypothetical protein
MPVVYWTHTQEDRDMDKLVDRFDTFEAFLQRAAIVPGRLKDPTSRRYSPSWHGTANFQQALDLAGKGWAEGAAKAAELRASIDHAVHDVINARSSSYTFDVSGEFVDVGRYLSGEPECFGTDSQEAGNNVRPVVKLCVNIAASGAVSPESLVVRGAAIVAAIDILEALGRRVEVWACKGSESRKAGKAAYEIHVLVKRADQPLDVDRLAFAVAHPACLRRLFFSVMERRGYLPGQCYPAAVDGGEGAIVTEHSRRGTDFSRKELLALVAGICGQAGVVIPEAEIEALS